MKESYHAGAYWGQRKETALECARRAERFFQMLAQCDPAFGQWYHAGRGFPRHLPGWPTLLEIEPLEALLMKGRSRKGVSKKVLEDMGFRTMQWNANEDPMDIHLRCGVYSPWSSNMCLLVPRNERSFQESWLCVPVMAEILTSMVTAWDPDFAVATSDEMSYLVKEDEGEVDVGWLTYVSRRLGHLPPLPAPVRIEPVGSLGWLLILSPERMSASQPEHVAFTTRIRSLLDRAGLIARPEPAPESSDE